MPKPPVAQKKSHEFEIHGRKVRDDYFWLRNKESKEVISYLEEENAYTEKMMAHTVELQDELFQEMKSRIKETDESVPIKIGDFYYYYRTEEGKSYKIHCRKKDSLDAPETVMLDENVLAENREYMKIGQIRISPNHRILAYSVDFTGEETFDTQIIDFKTGEIIDTIKQIGMQFEWNIDSESIFYTELDEIHRPFAISMHKIGSEMSADVRIFEEKDTSYMVIITKSRDGEYIFIVSAYPSSETTEVHYIELKKPNWKVRVFNPREEGVEVYPDHSGGYFYFLTNTESATNFKFMRTKVSEPDRKKWEELVPHNPDVKLSLVCAFENHIVIGKREDGYAAYMIYDSQSRNIHDVQLPEAISALVPTEYYEILFIQQNLNPVYRTNNFRFVQSSPVTPRSFYNYNMDSHELELLKVDEVKGYDASEFVTERLYALAKDGTKIPISISCRKDISLKSSNPTLLYGYGAYEMSTDPDFQSIRLSLIERGVIFAIAHVRGGGEFGKTWYHQGKLKHKMNTFTDFIACAEYLISNNITSTEKLCIFGESAGGLLMGAVTNLRPDLFNSVVTLVPFVDVINTMLDDTIPLTTFEYKEWGNPSIEEEFQWMMEYSPYDNISEKEYPHILVAAGLNDKRVHYWEPAKWTAKLRALKTDDNTLLLKMRMSSGHSGKSGRYEALKDWAFYYSFVLDTLKLV